ncbi:hypothetical protein [Sporosarcina sp. HYO08]|uniref:hypothetical protein n=1 Tax=Sporosarcina sp. HYO08 TaxID=1759557 RepID=UPI000798CE9A|nr:hypothetical protein [Sporosarcina sp. HYO08]KXH78809.1 hypothetical protein AU377_12475 [Sporosarcina sp. HYO08]
MFRLPFLFIATGMIGFVLFHLVSMISTFHWLFQDIRGPEGWFYTHLFVLGWATMLAMGAFYQLINVILQKDIYSRKLGYVHYAFFTVGLIGLLYGFLTFKTVWIGLFATLAFVGVILFAINIFVTLFSAKKWDPITISVACAVLYLVLTGLFGMWMGIHFWTGDRGTFHEQLFGAHIWLGTIGWFGLLIVGFSFKMLPMFYLAHHYPLRLQWATLITWNAAAIWGAVSFLLGGSYWTVWASLVLLTIAISLYTFHLYEIQKHRVKPNPGYGILWSVTITRALLVSSIGIVLYTVIFPNTFMHSKLVLIAGWIYLGGWVTLTILGYASKIIPFLWWTQKYGKQAGRPGTPLMADLLNDRKVNNGMRVVVGSVLLLTVALIISSNVLIAVAGFAFSLSAISYMILIGRVFTR